MKRIFCIILLCILFPFSSKALDEKYSPFSEKELKQIKTSTLKPNLKTDIRCDIKTTEETESILTIFYKDKAVYEELFDFWFNSDKPIIADVDGNGYDDVVKNYYHGSQGLALGCDLLIFSQVEPGHFVKLSLPCERFTKEDISDIDGDKRKEIFTCLLVNYEKHNYWVYRIWHLEGKILKNVDNTYKFPRAIWFTNKPNSKLVSQELLNEIMKNYPKIINKEMKENKSNDPNE